MDELIPPPDAKPWVSLRASNDRGATTPTADQEGISAIAAVAPVISSTIAARACRRPIRSARRPITSAPTGRARNDAANTAKSVTSPASRGCGGSTTVARTEAIAPKTAKSYHSMALATQATRSSLRRYARTTPAIDPPLPASGHSPPVVALEQQITLSGWCRPGGAISSVAATTRDGCRVPRRGGRHEPGGTPNAGAVAGPVDGDRLRRRIDLLPAGPLSRLSDPRGSGRRRGHLLRGLAAVHRRRRTAGMAGRPPAGGTRCRAGRVVDGDSAVRRNALLQRHHLPRSAHCPVERVLRPAGLATRRVRLDLFPRLGSGRLPRLGPAGLAAGAGFGRLVAAWGQPPGLPALRCRGGRRVRRALVGLGAGPGGRELDDSRRRGVLPGLRGGEPPRPAGAAARSGGGT